MNPPLSSSFLPSEHPGPTLAPSGTVTLLFTDIENSSTMWEAYRDAFKPVLDQHNVLLRALIAQHNGVELRHQGDGFFLTFNRASDAVQFAVEATKAIESREWTVTPLSPPGSLPITLQFRVRMGMHTCEAQDVIHPTGAVDYAGAEVNRAARVGGSSHGGQIIISAATLGIVQRQLPDLNFIDLGSHRLKGVGEEHLWQVAGRGLPEEFPPPSTLNAESHNLPLPSTPYIGRGEQLKEWREALTNSAARLLTITGFGGMGKTRFALQLAESCVGDFPDGVWWVPLENARTGDEMISRIAEQLRVHLQPQPTVEEQLWNFHRNRRLLLVLDNLEQIEPSEEAGRVVYGLLNAGPGVKCLVTSRRHLGLGSERLIELEPLPATEAETLFAERARARKSSFALDERNIEDVRAICRTLDGMPLAIEIAASLIVLLPPRQILKRLDDRLRALQTRAPDMPARHLALRAAIDWSYNLLTEDARALFGQLSVFVGGFTLEAAEAICTASDVMESLLELRTGSLLRATTDPETQEERLRMLGSVRDYALETCEDPEIGARHANYYLEFVRDRIQGLRTRDEATGLQEMEAEFDNLHAALDWAEINDRDMCVELSTLFSQPLYLRGRWEESRQVQEQGMQVAASLGPEELARHPRLQYQAACLADDLGRSEEGRRWAESALEGFRAANDPSGTANALNLLGIMATSDGNAVKARELLEEALRLMPARDQAGRAKALHNLGRSAAQLGETAEAWRLYEESLTPRRRAGDERGEAKTLSNMGVLSQEAGDMAKARHFYEQSLQLLRNLRDSYSIAVTLNNLGELAALESDDLRAISLFVHAERMFRELQSPLETHPAKALRDLEGKLGSERYAPLRAEAERSAWENLV